MSSQFLGMSKSQIEGGVAVTVALSLARRYVFEQPGYSAYCLIGGIAAMEAAKLASYLPASVNSAFANVTLLDNPGQVASLIISGVALEMAVNGSIEAKDFMSAKSPVLIGALAAFIGFKVSSAVKSYFKQ
jgi:hypothetical protein